MLIGMFHKRRDPNKVSRAYLFSALVKNEGADFFYFTASGVDFEKQRIKGLYYDKGIWKKKDFPFPDVIINVANQESRKQKLVENKLKEIIPFTSYPVGSKPSVYKRIINGGLYQQHVIPYRHLWKTQDLYDMLEKYGKVVIKPIRGHHGDYVTSIEKEDDIYYVREKYRSYRLLKTQLDDYINNICSRRRMLVQKFIKSELKTGEPYDYRMHLQKNKEGLWVVTIIFPRVASKGRVITNLSQGSQMIELARFLVNQFGDEANLVRKQLHDFALNFVKHFESLYPYQFDELALDVGFDENRKIWIYEVNWRPGHIFIEVETARNAIGYAMYLARKKKEKNETIKTI